MTTYLPQKYQEVAREVIPYVPAETDQIALIGIDPALPCFICSQPATKALITLAPEHVAGEVIAWLTFPICASCEKRQIKSRPGPE